MRKFGFGVCVLLILLGTSATAAAVPFQVTGSSVTNVHWDSGGFEVDYTAYSMDSFVDLGDGESFNFTFGSLELPLFTLDNSGSFNLGIQLSSPDFSGSVQNGGSFKDVWSLGGIISGGDLYFGGPVSFGYDYNGTPGVMTLALADLSGIQWGKTVDITGTITNSVAPAPEPTAILIMGAGLLGITIVSRKQLKTKK